MKKIIDLKYKRTYFTFKNDYFFIEVERSIFPFAILIDIDINNDDFATCIYNDLILNCSVDSSIYSTKFNPKQEEYYCAINWTNSIDEKLLIKLNYDSFWASNAEYVENKWTFEIFNKEFKTYLIDNYYYYAGIVLIKQDGTKNFTISKCSINTYCDKCIMKIIFT